jgi:hypothetical protein
MKHPNNHMTKHVKLTVGCKFYLEILRYYRDTGKYDPYISYWYNPRDKYVIKP